MCRYFYHKQTHNQFSVFICNIIAVFIDVWYSIKMRMIFYPYFQAYVTINVAIVRTVPVSCSWKMWFEWWRHQMEKFSALLAICAGYSLVPGEFTAQRPVTRSFDVFFDLRLNNRLSKQSWGWWFETLSHPLWRHCNELPDSEPQQNKARTECIFLLIYIT